VDASVWSGLNLVIGILDHLILTDIWSLGWAGSFCDRLEIIGWLVLVEL